MQTYIPNDWWTNTFLRKNWWKYIGAALVAYSIVAGFLGEVPRLNILNETIRNLYFHVPMWFAMMFTLLVSFVRSIQYLKTNNRYYDLESQQLNITAMVLGVIGLLTGMMWAKFTWNAWWVNDPKLNAVAVAMLIYLAYFVLRGGITDDDLRGRISAVYSIFAFIMFMTLIMVIPRLYDSLHPGGSGNPAFSLYDNKDLNSNMRLVFYPAVIGWIFLAGWLNSLLVRIQLLVWKRYKIV